MFLRESRPLKTRAEFPSEEEVFPFLGITNPQCKIKEFTGSHCRCLVIFGDFDVGLFSLLNGVESIKVGVGLFQGFQMNTSYQVVVRLIGLPFSKTGTSPRLRRLPFHNITVPAPIGALEHLI